MELYVLSGHHTYPAMAVVLFLHIPTYIGFFMLYCYNKKYTKPDSSTQQHRSPSVRDISDEHCGKMDISQNCKSTIDTASNPVRAVACSESNASTSNPLFAILSEEDKL